MLRVILLIGIAAVLSGFLFLNILQAHRYTGIKDRIRQSRWRQVLVVATLLDAT